MPLPHIRPIIEKECRHREDDWQDCPAAMGSHDFSEGHCQYTFIKDSSMILILSVSMIKSPPYSIEPPLRLHHPFDPRHDIQQKPGFVLFLYLLIYLRGRRWSRSGGRGRPGDSRMVSSVFQMNFKEYR
ncbi:hypothetical protein GN316_10290 [Xylophilus sp. Kf1]|nr:hypothetical protein [Xylophilus sp. Kf1]